MPLSIFTLLGIHPSILSRTVSSSQTGTPSPLDTNSPLLTPGPWRPHSTFYLCKSDSSRGLISRITQDLSFCDNKILHKVFTVRCSALKNSHGGVKTGFTPSMCYSHYTQDMTRTVPLNMVLVEEQIGSFECEHSR